MNEKCDRRLMRLIDLLPIPQKPKTNKAAKAAKAAGFAPIAWVSVSRSTLTSSVLYCLRKFPLLIRRPINNAFGRYRRGNMHSKSAE